MNKDSLREKNKIILFIFSKNHNLKYEKNYIIEFKKCFKLFYLFIYNF
jgi:hypothetical protein